MELERPWDVVNRQFNCEHADQQMVKYKQSNGRWRVRYACRSCGEYTTSDQKMAGLNLSEIPVFDSSLKDRTREEKSKALDEARQTYYDRILAERTKQNAVGERSEQSKEWWNKYNEYLHSQQWYEIRKRVLDRDRNICQACLRNKATQVHHKSYEIYNMIGRSAAFELVSICYQCHKLIHPHMAEAQYEVTSTQHNPYVKEVPQWMKE